MVERTMVNLLETTSSFSFKAAALLEGIDSKGFPSWQQLQNQGLGKLQRNLGRSFGGSQYQQQKRRQQRASIGGAVGSAASGRAASSVGGSGMLRHSMDQQPQQQQQQQLPEVHRSTIKHTRSKSLSSIQSGSASNMDEDDYQDVQDRHSVGPTHYTESKKQQQQQQQRGPGSVGGGGSSSSLHSLGGAGTGRLGGSGRGSHPNLTSPFAVQAQQRLGFGGFGSVVSLYSPTWENQGSADHLQELEELLADGDSPAAAAAVEAVAAAAAAGNSPAAAAAAAAAAARRIGKSSSGGGAGNSSGGGAVSSSGGGGSGAAPRAAATAQPHSLLKQAVGVGRSQGSSKASGGFEPSLAALPSANIPRTSDATTTTSTADEDGSSPTEGSGTGGFGVQQARGGGKGISRGSGSSAEGATPPFLDMVPWYSGTSADLFKTMFDLMISVKLFLGRFDMRTMQVSRPTSESLLLQTMHQHGHYCRHIR
jgi:hypothetical protein